MSANEYLPNDSEDSEPKKAFKIIPAEDDNVSSIAPRLRKECRHSALLGQGAKVLFDELTDWWFFKRIRDDQGAVVMSKNKLSDYLCVDIRTISRWQRELERNRFIWTRTFFKGGFELTRWFIPGLSNPQNELFANNGADPSYGRSRRSGSLRKVEQGTNGQFCPKAKSDEMPIKSPVNGHPCPVTTDNSVPGPGTNLSVDNGHPCPWPRDIPVPGPGTNLSVDQGQNCPQPTDTAVRSQGTGMSESKSLEAVKESGDSSKRLSKRAGAASESNRPSKDEFNFLRLCVEVLGIAEMEKNGGMWRNNFRENPRKAWSVIRETESMKKERRIKTTPPKTAMDLWINDRVGA